MIRTLLRKELAQHGLGLGILVFLAFLAYLILVAAVLATGQMLSLFEAFGSYLRIGAVLASATLGRLLVVSEYRAKTQLFLEALPLSRVRMITVKWCLGAAILALLLGSCFLLTLALGGRQEALTPRFVLFLGARAAAYAFLAYAFFFLMGLVGKYRFAFYGLAGLFFTAAAMLRQFEPGQWGPFALLGETFAYEREIFPWRPFLVTLAWGLFCLATTYLLALVREGSVSALLAERMSHREKILVTLALLGGCYALFILDEQRAKEPFRLVDAVETVQAGARVQVAGNDEAARLLAESAAQDLADLASYLEAPELLPVFIAERRDLDPDLYERAELPEAEGLLVRANFRHREWDPLDFQRWLVGELLDQQTDGAVRIESRRWVYDGFPDFWMERRRPGLPLAERDPLILRALYGTPGGVEEAALSRWLTTREALGDRVAAAVAWSGLQILAETQGEEACRRFVRDALDLRQPHDVRAMLRRWRQPLGRLLQSRAGLSPDAFRESWNAGLERCRAQRRQELEKLPRLAAAYRFVPGPGNALDLSYQIHLDPETDAPAPYRLRYAELPPMNAEVAPSDIEEHQHEDIPGTAHTLPRPFPRGTRLFLTASLDVPELQCPVVSGWIRATVRP